MHFFQEKNLFIFMLKISNHEDVLYNSISFFFIDCKKIYIEFIIVKVYNYKNRKISNMIRLNILGGD